MALTPACLHALLIYYLSSQPVLVQGPQFPHFDKLVHAAIFGVFAFLVAWGLFRAFPEFTTGRVLGLTVLAGVCYGGLDELHQYFVPFRTSDPLDLVADAVGVLLVVGVWRAMRREGDAVARSRPAGSPPVDGP